MLSQADLLRNYPFMCLPTRGKQVYETHWLPLQSSLSNDELEQSGRGAPSPAGARLTGRGGRPPV